MADFEVFSSNDDKSYAHAPDYFRRESLMTLMPTEIVYPIASRILRQNEEDGIIYVNGHDYVLDATDREPVGNMDSRVPIMRVIGRSALSKERDVFVADMRRVSPADVLIGMVVIEGPHSVWLPIKATYFTNAYTGNLDFKGDVEHRVDVDHLIKQTDSLRDKLESVESAQQKIQEQLINSINHPHEYQPRHAKDLL